MRRPGRAAGAGGRVPRPRRLGVPPDRHPGVLVKRHTPWFSFLFWFP